MAFRMMWTSGGYRDKVMTSSDNLFRDFKVRHPNRVNAVCNRKFRMGLPWPKRRKVAGKYRARH